MRGLQAKLHSRRGASMLLALLFLLVCLTVGAVVLTAASVNSGRLTRNRLEQQEYLAVSSAVELVWKDIAGTPPGTFTDSYREIVTEVYHPAEYDGEGNLVSEAYTTRTVRYAKDPAKVENSKLLELNTLLEPLNGIYLSTVPSETGLRQAAPGAATVTLDLALPGVTLVPPLPEGEEYPVVSGELRVNPKDEPSNGEARYAIAVELYTLRDGMNRNTMVMKLSPKVTNSSKTVVTYPADNTTVTTKTFTTEVEWGEAVITKKEAGA